MKRILALLAVALLISTCSAVFSPTDNDRKWMRLMPDDLNIIASDFRLAGSAANNLDYINTKMYCEYLKTDASKALVDSESYIVSEELLKAKAYYERAFKEYYSIATEMIEEINTVSQPKFENATSFHLMEGMRYLELATREIDMLAPA